MPSTNEVRVSWTTVGDKESPCPVTTYRVRSELINKEQCERQSLSGSVDARIVDGNTTTISSLLAYSTYRVHVVPASNAGANFMKSQEVTTNEGGMLSTISLPCRYVLDCSISMSLSYRDGVAGLYVGNLPAVVLNFSFELNLSHGTAATGNLELRENLH